ncbi:MAG: FHA domain-containing protein, partial [Thermosynechococcaceae cyanobacterium]
MKNQFKHLFHIYESNGIRTMLLYQDSYSIGRDKQNDIVLFSKLVSRCHARLAIVPGKNRTQDSYHILDGNATGKLSTNGITVNNKRCTIHCLRSGDNIEIGDIKLSYYIEQAKPLHQAQLSEAADLQQVEDFAPLF